LRYFDGMDLNRRHLIGASVTGMAGALAVSPEAARAAPLTSTLGRDATQYGVRPGSPDDQTRVLQRAIDEATRAQAPLALPPGVYRTGMLRLQTGSQLVGVRGATRFVFNGGQSLLLSEGAGHIGISNVTLDGGGITLPARRGLVSAAATFASPTAKYRAAAVRASGSNRFPATSAATSSPGRRRRLSSRSTPRA
jgi:uncharacterized secreted repeat protein (TIGR03808 family)